MKKLLLTLTALLYLAAFAVPAHATSESPQWTLTLKPITFKTALQEFEKFEYSADLGYNKALDNGWNMSFSGLDETSDQIRQNYADNISANLGHEDTDMRFGIKFRRKLQ